MWGTWCMAATWRCSKCWCLWEVCAPRKSLYLNPLLPALPGSLAQDRDTPAHTGVFPWEGRLHCLQQATEGQRQMRQRQSPNLVAEHCPQHAEDAIRALHAWIVKQPSAWWPIPGVLQSWCCHTHLALAEETALRKFMAGLHCSTRSHSGLTPISNFALLLILIFFL